MGTKRHVLVDGRGVPLSIVVTGANRHDVTQLKKVLGSLVIERPQITDNAQQHLCANKGYHGQPSLDAICERGCQPHVVPRGEKQQLKKHIPGYRARRWVVEVSHFWLNRFRKLLVRFEKTDASYIALLCLASAIIAWRKVGVIYG